MNMKQMAALVLAAAALTAHADGRTEAEWTQMETAVRLSAENTKRYQDTYSDIYFDLGSLTTAEFERRVAAGDTVYAYIGRPSCGDCNAFEPLFKRYITQRRLDGKIWFVNVHRLHQDKEKWQAFRQRYGLSGTPVLAKYAGGRQQNKLDFEDNGGISAKDLERWLDANGL